MSFQYHPGNIPIILSVPHGGLLDPAFIPDRQHGCPTPDGGCVYEKNVTCADEDLCYASTVTDQWTIEVSHVVADTIESLFGEGQRPHMIISNLKRTKLDPNREVEEAAQGDPFATAVYHVYHEYIELARGEVGRGILYDIHRQVQSVISS